MKNFFHQTFSSLKIKNYRLYYFGQIISVSGTFLQSFAQDWLVLELTNSGTLVGIVLAFQFLPMFLLSPYVGVIADRFPKLRLLFFTQTASMIIALSLGLLVITGHIQLWMIFVFALCLGLVNSVDNPVRQSFVSEIVGKEHVKNAVSLWAILVSVCRIAGPALAGVLIATLGTGICFLLNSASYIAVLAALLSIDKNKLIISPPVEKAKGQILEGFRYVKKHSLIFASLVMMAIIGTLTFEWQASLPLFSKFTLHGDASTYSILSVAMGIGMIGGGLFNASRGKSALEHLIFAATGFGISVTVASLSPNVFFASVVFVFVGLFAIMFANLSNSLLQVESDPSMRGRVMALWSIAFIGSTAIGGPLIGWVGEMFGPRWSLALGGIAALVAAFYGFTALKKHNLDHTN